MSISRHTPQRTCVACRRVASKRELVRIVAAVEGVVVDETGRKNGRGAYLCPTPECWEKAVKTNKLSRALRTGVSAQDANRLYQYVARLKEGV